MKEEPQLSLIDQSKPIRKGIGQESGAKEDDQESDAPNIPVWTEKRNSANPYEYNP